MPSEPSGPSPTPTPASGSSCLSSAAAQPARWDTPLPPVPCSVAEPARVSEQGQILRGLSLVSSLLSLLAGLDLPFVDQHYILLLAPSPGPQTPEAEVWDIPFQ